MQEDMVVARAHAAAFEAFNGHGARDDIARGEVARGRRIALHETHALGVGEVAALAARAHGDEAAGAVDLGRVELHELHVLVRKAGARDHAVAVPRAGMGRSAGEIGAPVTAGREDHQLRAEAVDRAVIEVPGDDAPAVALRPHDEVEREIFDEEFCRVAQALLVKRVQQRMARPVGGRAGALRRAFAPVLHVAAEGPLVDPAFRRAGEGHAEMFELDHRRHGVAAHIFDGVLVAQPVRALHSVVHVPAPVVLAHVPEAGGDAALRGDGMAAGREHLGDAGGLPARPGRIRASRAGPSRRLRRRRHRSCGRSPHMRVCR